MMVTVKAHHGQLKRGKASLNRREEITAAGKYSVVIGIDEAGRGPLCGPVVAAACIVPNCDDLVIDGIIDSKKLTNEEEREAIYENLISDKRVMWFASIVTNSEIDSINILQASLAAMKRATEGLIKKYHLTDHSSFIALIDGNKVPENMPVSSKFIVKGDGHIFSIAAASIIAKVTRDRIMIELDKKYPIYGLAKHKGYPTAFHRRVLYEHGPCEIYRMSYLPVKKAAERMEQMALNKVETIISSSSSVSYGKFINDDNVLPLKPKRKGVHKEDNQIREIEKTNVLKKKKEEEKKKSVPHIVGTNIKETVMSEICVGNEVVQGGMRSQRRITFSAPRSQLILRNSYPKKATKEVLMRSSIIRSEGLGLAASGTLRRSQRLRSVV